ncbi:hypothetical protein G3I71_33440 [Streptomyces sp. SID12501]|uniref:Uncharacterized protein n=2 Tax=Streptomyces sp. SID12501 TaxID=2706042 RepID=A0A6B3C2G6_9ACTN|nr:hypothetical protein [Streptomyces sp. SID12501]NEC90592.1 hypothetical protein [Streptomyces sp. SID12501]
MVAVGAVALTPGSAMAAAATKCSSQQHKEFDTVGVNLDLYVTLCVHRTAGNDYYAYADIAWSDGGGGASSGMEKLVLNLRLERNDADFENENVSIAGRVNYAIDGSTRVVGSTYHSATTGGWTADGSVAWNIQNDGDGGGTWSLGGSPSI